MGIGQGIGWQGARKERVIYGRSRGEDHAFATLGASFPRIPHVPNLSPVAPPHLRTENRSVAKSLPRLPPLVPQDRDNFDSRDRTGRKPVVFPRIQRVQRLSPLAVA